MILLSIIAILTAAPADDNWPTDPKAFIEVVLDKAVQELEAAVAEHERHQKPGAAKAARDQLRTFQNTRAFFKFAGKLGFAKELYNDPAWTALKKSLETAGEKSIAATCKAVLKKAAPTTARRLVWAFAVGLEIFDPQPIAMEPEELLRKESPTEEEKAWAIRQILLQDRVNDYQLALIMKVLGYAVDPEKVRTGK
jgi:hypothetical protein